MKIRLFFAWYDFYIGGYWDREHKVLYLLVTPMVGIRIEFAHLTPQVDEIAELRAALRTISMCHSSIGIEAIRQLAIKTLGDVG